ncbi:MAG: hypothetical protein WCR42_12545 [bacterium]
MRLKRQFYYVLTIFAIVGLTSCGSLGKVTTLNPNTGRFPAKKKTINIINKTSVNADTLKTLIIVPDTPYWIGMVQNMKFFNEVMTMDELEKDIIKKGLTEQIPTLSNYNGLKKAYKYYKPFVIIMLTEEKKSNGSWYVGFELFDPSRVDKIFQNEIHINQIWSDWTDRGTMYPLFNSLLDYLTEQK